MAASSKMVNVVIYGDKQYEIFYCLFFCIGGNMSKLYKKYLQLKNENSEKYYLFHSGIFYIFLAEDSAYLSKKLGLKQTKFTDEVNKCGFPQNSKAKYVKFLNEIGIDHKIIEKEDALVTVDHSVLKKLKEIKKINFDERKPMDALTILYELQEVLK